MELRALSLAKAGRQYIFRFPRGQELQVVQAILETTADGEAGLDWTDAAVLCHQALLAEHEKHGATRRD